MQYLQKMQDLITCIEIVHRSQSIAFLLKGWHPPVVIQEKHIGSSFHRPDLTVLRDSNKTIVL